MFKEIARALGLLDRSARAVARRSFAEQHPGWRCQGTSIRAAEESRFVVAVFYQVPGLPSFPAHYKFYAVSRDFRIAEELPCTPESPYWIRGRK